jgi:hypothetical protein
VGKLAGKEFVVIPPNTDSIIALKFTNKSNKFAILSYLLIFRERRKACKYEELQHRPLFHVK